MNAALANSVIWATAFNASFLLWIMKQDRLLSSGLWVSIWVFIRAVRLIASTPNTHKKK